MKRTLITSDEDEEDSIGKSDAKVLKVEISPLKQEEDFKGKSTLTYNSEDSDEPLSTLALGSRSKKAGTLGLTYNSEDSDEPLSTLALGSRSKKARRNQDNNSSSESSPGNSEDEKEEKKRKPPISSKGPKKARKDEPDHSSSEASSTDSEDKGDKEKIKMTKKPFRSFKGVKEHEKRSSDLSSMNSEEEVGTKERTTAKKSSKASKSSSSARMAEQLSTSDPSPINSEDEIGTKKINPQRPSKSSKTVAKKDPLQGYKHYIRVMGIHINNYETFFKGCKRMAARKDKLLYLMKEKGLKGRPSLEKCKKIRLKLERKKEIAELDLGNIISDSGRGRRRNVESLYATRETRKNGTDSFHHITDSPAKPSRIKVLSSDSESD